MKRSNHSSSHIIPEVVKKNNVNSLTVPYSFQFSRDICQKRDYVSNEVTDKQMNNTNSEKAVVTINSTTSFLSQGQFGSVDTVKPFVFYGPKQVGNQNKVESISHTYPMILLKDITLHLGDSWHPMKSFIKAIDENGDRLRLNQLSVAGVVNQNVPGIYEVQYSYKELIESAVVVVKEAVHDIQIEVRDVSLSVGDIWSPKDSFVGAIDEYDEEIPFERISVSDTVDTSVPGLTMLFFKYHKKTVPVYINVEHRLPTADEEKEIATTIIAMVNKLREKLSLPLLIESNQLIEIAETRALDLPILYSHTRPNGDDCFALYKEQKYLFTEAGENIGYIKARGTVIQNASALFLQWKNSPGHYANLINPNFTEIGVGINSDETVDRIIYASQNFGNQQKKPRTD